jgi:hypothetical protein
MWRLSLSLSLLSQPGTYGKIHIYRVISHSTLSDLCSWYSYNAVQADVWIEGFVQKGPFYISLQCNIISVYVKIFSCYPCRSVQDDKFFPLRAPHTRKWNWKSSCDFERSFLIYSFSSSYPLIANFFALFITKGHPICRNPAITETRSQRKVTLCQLTPKSHWTSANSSCYY